MLTVQQILFPIDFSERCRAAAPFVATMAQRFKAEVTLLAALPPIFQADPTGMMLVEMPVSMDELLKDLEARLAAFLVPELAGVTVRRVAKIGDPATVITDHAHDNKVDLIMMPSHGWGPFRGLLLGSVTNKVLHDAECPVWTSAHTEEVQVQKHQAIRNVVCALDGSDSGVNLLKWTAQFARALDANLHLAHSVTGVGGWPEAQLSRDFEETLREQARQLLEKQKTEAGVIAPLCIGVGDIPAVIRKEAEQHNADVVVISRGVLDRKLGRLRTHAYSIIRNAPCPVISV